jgi:hypothetical protein
VGEAKRRKAALANIPCYCRSQKPAGTCCFNGITWYKPPAVLGLKNLPPASVVDQCYMAELKSCGGGLSGEHLITEAVMRLLAGDGEFTIAGLPWIPAGERRSVGFKSFVAKCLCEKHNSALHPFDDAALVFFTALRTCYEDNSQAHNFLVNGHDIESWLLKTLKALAVSGNLAKGQQRLKGAFATHIGVIDMLDHPESWPAGSGLYCVMRVGDVTQNDNHFQLQPVMDNNDDIIGLWANFLGLSFALSLEPIDTRLLPEEARAQYRPGQIRIQHPQLDSFIAISWIGEGKLKQTMSLKFKGKV